MKGAAGHRESARGPDRESPQALSSGNGLQQIMATIRTVAPTAARKRSSRPAAAAPKKRNALAPARGSAKREAAKLSEFREKSAERKRKPEDYTVRTSLFGGRRT